SLLSVLPHCRPPRIPPLFPYTTLFRSAVRDRLPGDDGRVAHGHGADPDPVHRPAASGDRGPGTLRAEGVSPHSDIDLLVDFAEDASLFDQIGLRLDLADLLGAEVDVVGSESLRGSFRDRVLAEAVPLLREEAAAEEQ